MRPNTNYSARDGETHIMIENTNTGTKIEAEIASRSDTSITVFLAGERIVLIKERNSYVGNKFGMELVYTP